MIPASFDYEAPATIEEAIALLQQHGDDAKVLTGGHSLIPLLRLRLARPAIVIDLRRIHGLKAISNGGSELSIGAAATHADVQASEDVRQACPLLGETAAEVGDLQVRNAGTIGGSVVHADPAADWPAALLAVGARMVLVGTRGERTVAAEDFFIGLLESAAEPGEILTRILVPVAPQGSGSAYKKVAQSASGFALAGAAVQLTLNDGTIDAARVGITGVAEHAYRPQEVEAALSGSPTDEASIEAACESAAAEVPEAPETRRVEVLADMHASAPYRAHLARVLTKRAVLSAIERARSGAG